MSIGHYKSLYKCPVYLTTASVTIFYFRQEETKVSRDDNNDDDDDDDDGDVCGCFLVDHVTGCRSAMLAFYSHHKCVIKRCLLAVLAALYVAYFIYALYYEFGDEGSVRLLWVTCLVVAILVISLIKRRLRPQLQEMSSSKTVSFIRRHHKQINWFVA